jgi:hypothetical protein
LSAVWLDIPDDGVDSLADKVMDLLQGAVCLTNAGSRADVDTKGAPSRHI